MSEAASKREAGEAEGRMDPTVVGHAHSAIASMLRLALKPSPQNFRVWFDYHAGENPMLRRVIDTYLSSGRPMDAALMQDLHARFCDPNGEAVALRDAASRLQEIMRHVSTLVGEAGADATRRGSSLQVLQGELTNRGPAALTEVVIALIAEVSEMSERSASLASRLGTYAQRVTALERRLEEALLEANTDTLTGLPNRRAFEEALHSLAGDAMNTGAPLSLMLLDVDRFKAVNDTFGHTVGDAVLRRIALTVRAALREDGLPARFGGEEFAVLLGGTTTEEAARCAERLRAAVASQTFSIRATGQTLGTVTVSIGVAGFMVGEALAAWLDRADAALYRAKQAGRNRVEVSLAAGEGPAPAVGTLAAGVGSLLAR